MPMFKLWQPNLHLETVCAQVCVCDVKEEVGQTAVAEMAGQFGADKVIFAPCDVRREEQIHGEGLLFVLFHANMLDIFAILFMLCYVSYIGKNNMFVICFIHV